MQAGKELEILRELTDPEARKVADQEIEKFYNAILFEKFEEVFNSLNSLTGADLEQSVDPEAGTNNRQSVLKPKGVPFIVEGSDLSPDATITIKKTVVEYFDGEAPEKIDWDNEPDYALVVKDGDSEDTIAFITRLGEPDSCGYETSFYLPYASRAQLDSWATEVSSLLDGIRADITQ